MLLFITYHSKTSLTTAAVSIHLMLLFIHTSFNFMQHLLQFQYISCYSLSSAIPLSYFLKHCFNTSHVTLYHGRGGGSAGRVPFQYISCYSLSLFLDSCLLGNQWFQYISCYSLSEQEFITPQASGVFQYISCYSLSIWQRINGHR